MEASYSHPSCFGHNPLASFAFFSAQYLALPLGYSTQSKRLGRVQKVHMK